MAKLPRLEHVKYVTARGKVYAYFNTGKKTAKGTVIYVKMPAPSAIGFYDSYASLKAGRTKRAQTAYAIADLARDYQIAMEKGDLAENTKRLYRKTIARVVEFLGEFPVNDVQAEDVQFVLDEKIVGAGSYNIFKAVVGVLYRWGRQRGKTTLMSPAKDIDKMKGGEHEPWPEPILKAGLKADDARVRLAIHLLYYTGQRIGDAVRMRWSDITDGEIFVTQQKTGKEVSPPLTNALAAELKRTPKRGITILSDADGKAVTERIIRAELKAFSLAHGKECVPHGLRKNSVIALLEAGCTVAEVSAITGQTFLIVEQYAARVNRRRLGKAAILKFDRSENKAGTGKRSGKQEKIS